MVKINRLEIENVKRVRAVSMEPSANGLTVIGGKNRQGKTSVLDAIAWALGGNKFKPSNPKNEDSVVPPKLHIELDNGLIVERSGKNSDLKVIDPAGKKSGQQLLDSFVEELALNLPKFMQQTNKEKANTLLQIIGVGDQLAKLEAEENDLYQQRTIKGLEVDAKRGYLKEMPFFPDVPAQPISASELIQQQQSIMAKNAENQRLRDNEQKIRVKHDYVAMQVQSLKEQLANAQKELDELSTNLAIAQKDILDLHDESTEELEQSLHDIEQINQKVALNQKHDQAENELRKCSDEYQEFTIQIENVRNRKRDLLNGADLPLPGLSIQDQELTFNGQKWDCMSSSEQMIVATSIVRKLNPNCGFVLLDKLEQLDIDTMKEFGTWLEQNDLQAIATRVSVGGECSIVIQDGTVVGTDEPNTGTDELKTGTNMPKWGTTWK